MAKTKFLLVISLTYYFIGTFDTKVSLKNPNESFNNEKKNTETVNPEVRDS